MQLNKTLKAAVFSAFLLVLMGSLIGFVQKKQDGRYVANVTIDIDNEYNNFFIGQNDVQALLTKEHTAPLAGTKNEEISLKALELRLKSHKFVKDAQVHRDLAGNLVVDIKQNRPIARLILPDEDRYIDREGTFLPLSDRYTARVLPVFTEGNTRLSPEFFTSEKGAPYLNVLAYIDSSDFWRAQIAEMHLQADGRVYFVPQIGTHKIELGKPVNAPQKLGRLMLYYKQVAPNIGWEKYHRINLEFENQIVCE